VAIDRGEVEAKKSEKEIARRAAHHCPPPRPRQMENRGPEPGISSGVSAKPIQRRQGAWVDLGHTCTTASVIDHQSSSYRDQLGATSRTKKVVDSQLEVRSFGGGRGGGADPAPDRGGEVDESNEATCMFVDVDGMVPGSQAYQCHQGLREICNDRQCIVESWVAGRHQEKIDGTDPI
jgi:hypothetical protein